MQTSAMNPRMRPPTARCAGFTKLRCICSDYPLGGDSVVRLKKKIVLVSNTADRTFFDPPQIYNKVFDGKDSNAYDAVVRGDHDGRCAWVGTQVCLTQVLESSSPLQE